jgi:hypothetical protein
MNVAQRRGKGAEKATTMTVEPADDDHDNAIVVPTTAAAARTSKGDGGGSVRSVRSVRSGDRMVETGTTAAHNTPPPAIVRVATVRRNKFGTGPFDKHWLNLDCCGLVCAMFTYFLHAYGVYAVNFVLLPPWMSHSNGSTIEGVGGEATHDATTTMMSSRSLSWWGLFHSAAFLFVSFMAVASHFYAMTTDPGAVPPDAKPLNMPEDDHDNENNERRRPRDMQSLLDPLPTPPGVKRLCRRCKTFKPPRAHHCSVCQRCIIKMDHHCPYVYYTTGLLVSVVSLHFLLLLLVSSVEQQKTAGSTIVSGLATTSTFYFLFFTHFFLAVTAYHLSSPAFLRADYRLFLHDAVARQRRRWPKQRLGSR